MNTDNLFKAIKEDYGISMDGKSIALPKEEKEVVEELKAFMRYGRKETNKNQYLIADGKLIALNLRSYQLTNFKLLNDPQYQTVFIHLKALNLTENELSEIKIPTYLKALQYLDISDNKTLSSFSFEAALPALKTFDASDSGLTKIHFPIGFERLTQIDISRNQLSTSTFAGEMPALIALDLSDNQLTNLTLPEGFDALNFLYLSNNQLVQLVFATDLNQLKTLHLKSNNLKALPIKRYAALETLYVQENPLEDYQENLIKGDESGNATEIIGLLRATATSGEGINYSAKLIVVGNGRIGKTCLVNRLKGEDFNENQEYTHGISIQQLTKKHLPNVRTKKLNLKVWDFGGQEVFYATHQFFLSEESAYIYAFTDKEIALENRAKDKIKSPSIEQEKWRSHEYWLDNIKMHGKESPIQVVKTHSLSARKSIPFEQLKKTYSLANETVNFDASSKESRYLENLKTSVVRLINDLPLLGLSLIHI